MKDLEAVLLNHYSGEYKKFSSFVKTDINVVISGSTALHIGIKYYKFKAYLCLNQIVLKITASSKGHTDIVEILLANNASVDVQDSVGYVPLFLGNINI